MKSSYVDPQKHRWHRIAGLVAMDRLLPDRPVALRKVVYLDTREALQTLSLLDAGYSASNLLATNFEAVEIALLTQKLDRLGYPRVCTKSGDFQFLATGFGQVEILDFDGTSNMAGEVGDVLLTNASLESTPRVLSFNILVGRENRKAMDALRIVGENHADFKVPSHTSSGRRADPKHWYRLMACLINASGHCAAGSEKHICLWHVEDWRWDIYRSTSGQTMAWMAARIMPHTSNLSAKSLTRNPPRWLRRAYRYGLAPTCVMNEIGRVGDTNGKRAIVLPLDSGMPRWSDGQFDYFCFTEQERQQTREECKDVGGYVGWPRPTPRRSLERLAASW